MLYTERQYPSYCQNGQCGSYGKKDGQQITCGSCCRHGNQHAEVENSAGGTKCHSEQHAEQKCSTSTFTGQTFSISLETERG